MIIAIFSCIFDAYNKYKAPVPENTSSISSDDCRENNPDESTMTLGKWLHLFFHPLDFINDYVKKKESGIKDSIKTEVQHDIDRRIYILKDAYLNLYERENWIKAFAYAFIFIFLPPLCFRAILYWIISPIVQNKGSLQFFESINQNSNTIRISDNEQKSLKADILPNESLLVVDESFVNGCEDNQNLEKTLQWLFSWKHPIMSFWCGLRTMNKYTNKSEKVYQLT